MAMTCGLGSIVLLRSAEHLRVLQRLLSFVLGPVLISDIMVLSCWIVGCFFAIIALIRREVI